MIVRHARQLAPARTCALLIGLLLVLGGCSADRPLNPSFDLRYDDAIASLREMEQAPVTPTRPILIASGIHDPGVAALNLERKLRKVLGGQAPIARVTFFETWSFDACRRKLLEAVREAFPSDDPDRTVEVDVIGISMGGLVARMAATAGDDGLPTLRIRRLFTIATPHRGAALATLPTLDRRAADMRAGSAFLRSLDEPDDAGYELHAYARLGDLVVGAENAAPEGDDPWWVANPPLSFAHLWASTDPRIVADIARRLRGQPPYARRPPAPLPGRVPVADDPPVSGPPRAETSANPVSTKDFPTAGKGT